MLSMLLKPYGKQQMIYEYRNLKAVLEPISHNHSQGY